MKNKKEIILLIIFIVLQSILYVCTGMSKGYIHIDEAYSFGLTNYDRVEIEENADFYNTWHEKEYYEDYLSIQEDERGNFAPVYENQKNDVHPPFYYLLLRIAMSFSDGHFSMWPGIVLNIVLYAFITIFMYLILKKLLKDEKNAGIKAAVLAFISSITLAGLSNAVYIRMYALLTLEILITTFLHIKLLESEKVKDKLLIGIGVTVLVGILTHYYYLVYLVALYIVILIKYIKEKKLKQLLYYTLTMLAAGIGSLVIFPYSIVHMFFGYRGQGVISNLEDVGGVLPRIGVQLYNLNYYGFNNMMIVIFAIIVVVLTLKIILRKKLPQISKENKNILIMLLVPSIFFFIVSAIGSPWQVLRYIVPVCGILFMVTIYGLYIVLKAIFSEKITNTIICIIFCVILVMPFIMRMEPELLYREKKEIVQELGGELNLPTIYLYSSGTLGFLNDIMIFAEIDQSYIAKDMECTEENIQNVFEDKDVSNGIIVFINDGQDNDAMLETTQQALSLTETQHLARLWSSNVYYVH